MRSHNLLNEAELAKVKIFFFSEQDLAKLGFLIRHFEQSRCLIKFRREVAGFMGDPYLGDRNQVLD